MFAKLAEAHHVGALGVAARYHQVGLRTPRLFEEISHELGRVLEIRIHNARPVTSCRMKTLNNGASETVSATVALPMNESNVMSRVLSDAPNGCRRRIVAVIYEYDLKRKRSRNAVEALNELGDISLFIPGGNHERELGTTCPYVGASRNSTRRGILSRDSRFGPRRPMNFALRSAP